MPTMTAPAAGSQAIREIQEFARLPACSQRYIRRSLEVRFGGRERAKRLARNPLELKSIEKQIELYERSATIAQWICDNQDDAANFLNGLLAPLADFDLGEGKLESFAAFRFLYERMIGPAVRPWLLGVFTRFATLPNIHPQIRLELLSSIDRRTAGASHWSLREPLFFPQWVERLDLYCSRI